MNKEEKAQPEGIRPRASLDGHQTKKRKLSQEREGNKDPLKSENEEKMEEEGVSHGKEEKKFESTRVENEAKEGALLWYAITLAEPCSLVITQNVNTVGDLTHLKEEYEFVYEGRVQLNGDRLRKTSKSEPYRLFPKRLKIDDAANNTTFFETRNIPLAEVSPTLLKPNIIFSDLLLKNPITIPDETRLIKKEQRLRFICESMLTYKLSNHESATQGIVNNILQSLPIENIQIITGQKIVAKNYNAKCWVDHVVKKLDSERFLLLGEDKNDQKQTITAAIYQNFDQLRIYADSVGQQYKYYYGAATTLYDWVFTCYKRRNPDTIETRHNFMVSKVIPIQKLAEIKKKGETGESLEEQEKNLGQLRREIEVIMRILTWLLDENIDKFIEKAFKNEDAEFGTPLEEKGIYIPSSHS